MAAYFDAEALRFLRGLIKHNDREWFEARRAVYERALKTPMLAIIDEVNTAFESFAPEHVRSPHKVMMRIYRDTRFSKDKRPYKRHMAAWWSRRGMEKTSGGGFYLQVSPTEVLIAAGVYMPERDQMLAIRRWMAEHHESYRKLMQSTCKKPRTTKSGAAVPFSGIDAQALMRMPKGFASDHPADDLLRAKNWGVHLTLPVEAALQPDFAGQIVPLLQRASPLVNMLNTAIIGATEDAPRVSRKPLF